MDGTNCLRCGAMIAVMLASLSGPALAENCRDRVQELAQQYKIETDPPTIPPGEMRRPVTPEDLARSGGVVEPPPTSDHSVVTPSRSHSGMPTLPEVAPPPPKAEADKRSMTKLDPSETTTLQALLVAARAQAERGMEQECLDGLRKAQRMIEHKR
jgi:hypothetical protein